LVVPSERGENFEISMHQNWKFSKEKSCILDVPSARSERGENFEISRLHNWRFSKENHVYWSFRASEASEEKILRFQGFRIIGSSEQARRKFWDFFYHLLAF